jgi:hypothetical protein
VTERLRHLKFWGWVVVLDAVAIEYCLDPRDSYTRMTFDRAWREQAKRERAWIAAESAAERVWR